MADFQFTFAVELALKKIVRSAAEQIGVAWNLKKEASQLTKELEYADAILADIKKRKLHQDFVKLWVKDLQEIVFEADDLLDKLRYEDLRPTGEQTVEQTVEQTSTLAKVRDYFSLPNSFLSRLEMAKKMEKIIETLHEHCTLAISFGITVHESSIIERQNDLMTNRETFSFLDFQPLKERDAEVSKILERVMKYSTNEHHMFVISIFGMGGLGKTTLAKMVFNHETIKGHFDQTIWVCVSKPFIVTKILVKINEDLSKSSTVLKYNKQDLVQMIRWKVEDEKYFLVLDDVWDTEKHLWEDLSDCLKQISGKFGNCIMVTTRSSEVAKTVGSVYPHQVEKLSNDQCWKLFKESANANQSSMEEMLENKKEELVKKMSGVPLVAKVLGGAVKFEGDYESWVTKVESIIARNLSIDDTDYIFSILKLSVDYLPHPVLKQCFAYCSNFPQDYNFEKDDLIQMWIAQEFIQRQQERENLTMEDLGEQCFNILLSRSLFQDVKMDRNNRIVGFKMHDLMHDIAVAISSHPLMESNTNNLSRESAKKLRTLILKDVQDIDYKVLDDLSCLLVLKLNRYYWDNNFQIPMNKLIHLRYLDIFHFSHLGPKLYLIFELYNLQTLKLGLIHHRDQLKNLKNLVNLRHLEYYTISVIQNPQHVGNLIHLQTLPRFQIGLEKGYKIEELGPLKNLKGKLSIGNLVYVQSKEEAMAAKLGEKKNLRRLNFYWSATGEDNDNYDDHKQVLEGLHPHKKLQVLGIRKFQGRCWPNNIFVENLVEIYLYDCERCVELPMLGQLPNLKKLIIEGMSSLRSIGNEFYGIDSNDHTNSFAFPKLAELYIAWMWKLEQWDEATVVIASNLFGCLKKLDICGCEQLAKLPSELEGCLSIEYLTIKYCPNLMLNVKNLHNLRSLKISEMTRWPEGLAELTRWKASRIQRL